MSSRPPFCGYLTASGQGETWDHSDGNKFKQFGWRCTTNETGYSHETLIGNWNEERYDTRNMSINKPIPSQYSHYFQTSYENDFKTKGKVSNLPDYVKKIGGAVSEPRSFPHHQPELDPRELKQTYNSFETTSQSAYKDPRTTTQK
ncbi:cilia- and flagella-associated protein 68-like [Rhopilema esculentum]|uniref:cilia- and flagella-associated protein 68-like n=1 Tax=Rhopilema esculentum TaxID=499914 RepID=UPI0031CDE1CC|eukprot:gene16203-7576_t